ncbi:bifunctional proline dehydrogenase/L-glutamate gamma-semialdehyde dehydrogenase PutA [Nordella sp. HKS 07]|uniref:bifunctional proline dehydrogenase/L-glutamate gamma-semialdehyde dehydrogenase PutA n=1 Tax=Nordella sp. HKS 07 TaxID=2712222 RepID=UPI0013E11567|nr:bifunctional proline dehydrogenase/L-glutamate gamma-semialdehyde dehydrogenase PutA [Nordella sp. HKS 07]QIG51294.1 bifunctional proline dehydrogenase/L-glutamate gamma-semialdehyde dehydrogenase PutA [Nordella sp. HKS 07]
MTTTPALPSRAPISNLLFADETALVKSLSTEARLSPEQSRQVAELARQLVAAVRAGRRQQGGIDAFMQEYSLSSEEGVVLMCLAEALLRIPDGETADKLIADKIGGKQWDRHIGQSESIFVNASAWGLMLTGRFVQLGQGTTTDIGGYLKRFVSRSGEPFIRNAMKHAMRIMGKQFVLGRTIEEALDIAKPLEAQNYRFSFDMLGEAAFTAEDARRYLKAYENAMSVVGARAGSGGADGIFGKPSISVKLSALHPRYEEKQEARTMAELLPRVVELAHQAKALDIGLTIDAEEVNRLDLSLELFGRLAHEPSLKGWNGLGLAVQAYGKRARPVLQWLADLASQTGRKLPVRLVKGAYWDTEVKRAQEAGLEGYSLFTRKVSTDLSYLACAKYLLSRRDVFYPQFATHNAHSLAAITVMAGDDRSYEFQRLHGMGQALYEEVARIPKMRQPCRIYAPVGSHEDLLAYLVRRLLENGANTSFVNRLADDEAPIGEIIADPVEQVAGLNSIPHPRIPLPRDIFAPRINSRGYALWDDRTREAMLADIGKVLAKPVKASALVSGKVGKGGPVRAITSPHDRSVQVGEVAEADEKAIAQAMSDAAKANAGWNARGGAARALILEKAAELYEANTARFMALLIREAGKTLDNAQADLREAVDFLRYYSERARKEFEAPQRLPGPTGELNEITLNGRGVFACISPWNFPLAIFTGQVAAALAAGNAAIAKPAEQTPLIAFEAVKLLHEAGVPPDVLQFLPGDGARIGKILLAHPALSGVAFTGSNDTASIINRTLAARDGAILPLIAETGGMNAMIVDSSALPEQAVRDVLASAFDSAGQRCSAARVLFVQEDIAGRMIPMLEGAMAELTIGDPLDFATDVGPVIDEDARNMLDDHKKRMAREAKTILDMQLPSATKAGTFVSPAAYEIPSLSILKREVFGPVLHVVRFAGDRLAEVCDALNATGFGLTLGLHTRIETTVAEVRAHARVGNMYVNRNQIGAVVGAQPFGGEGLSGTGPKAGGPNYLNRFATERVCSVDTTASGGNAALMSMGSGERGAE